jgi:hypothetical protein
MTTKIIAKWPDTTDTPSVKAVYGTEEHFVDVSDALKRQLAATGRVNIRATNQLAGDPAPGQEKSLRVIIQDKEFEVREGRTFVWPEAKGVDHLVIFYSHVNPQEDKRQGSFVSYCLNHLLDTVPDNVAVRGGLIHSYPIEHSKFYNYTPIYREGIGHAMIMQQIYRTLLAARNEGLTSLKYVSFAEHDNLYPASHFQFEDFEEDLLINTNHIGFTQDGFQKRQENETWPTFSMTMKYDYAVEYFKSRIQWFFEDPDAFGLIEPITDFHFENLSIGEWTDLTRKGLTCTHKLRETEEPILHLWNGRHNTSHFQTYPKDEYLKHNAYWGDAQQLAKAYYGDWLPSIPKIPD